MIYHYKGYLIIFCQATNLYTLYIGNGLKCTGLETMQIATMTADLLGGME